MRRGFTLVELSIVLVIIGLLVGGVMAGQSIIRASELRSLIADYDRYSAAVTTFYSKFNGLPGDIKDATDYWGIAAGTTGNDATCWQQASTDAKTCNGNGDSQITNPASGTGSESWYYEERFRAWQQLANAGLIEGKYTGVTGPANNVNYVFGTNAPSVRMPNAGAQIFAQPAVTGSTEWFDGPLGTMLAVTSPTGYVLKPDEAYNIDMKMDDGRPAYGRVIASKPTGTWMPNCATTDVSATAQYNVTYASKACYLWVAVQ